MDYKYNDKTQLTPSFNVSEFRCKCGGTHDTLLDTTLVEKLEKLKTALNCKSVVVNSGYRCSAHDVSVGGNGRGQHTLGKAADIVCYGQDGKKIRSEKVCCAAQDIGFGGIANIDSSYTATHVDVRSTKWFGDETKGDNYSIPTGNFYKHFNLSKAEVYGAAANTTPATQETPATPSEVKVGFSAGDLVSIKDSASTYYGSKSKIPAWVKAKKWYVKEVNGDRITIDKSEDGENAICSAVKAEDLINSGTAAFKEYGVKVTASALNVRTDPGTNYPIKSTIFNRGEYTITGEADGAGAKRWGKLKSGAGWISLDYTEKL